MAIPVGGLGRVAPRLTALIICAKTLRFAPECLPDRQISGKAGLVCWTGFCLIQYGHETPLPLDPPRRLVVCGPYQYVRNPQAVAMVLMAAGEVVAIRSLALWMLLPATVAYLELLVGPWEERQMARDFGPEYESYVRRVEKWLPRQG